MNLLRNLHGWFREKKQFRGSDNSLTGEVKHKSMRFSFDKKYFLANQNSHKEQKKLKNNMKVV